MMRGPSHDLGIGVATTVLALTLACTSTPSAEDATNTDSASSTSTSGETTTATETSSSGDGDGDGDATTTDDTEGSSGECVPYIPDDCNDPNQKCMPYSVADDSIPDEMRCCALSPNPVSPGERCEIQDYDGSCLDNCPNGSVCVLDRPDELEGYCQVFCDPGAANSCGDQQICKSFFEMIESAANVPVCMSRCDPLLQDCESKGRPGWSCLPEGALSPSFLCMPPGSESPKLEYDSCLLANDCEVGLACVPSSEVLGCDGLFNCCTRYCDLTEPDTCTMGNECISLESDVPGLEDVGVCADPL